MIIVLIMENMVYQKMMIVEKNVLNLLLIVFQMNGYKMKKK